MAQRGEGGTTPGSTAATKGDEHDNDYDNNDVNRRREEGRHSRCGKAAGRPGGVSGYPRAWYRSVSRVRAPPSANWYKFVGGLSLVHELTCGKRESVSKQQHSTKN